MSEFAITRRKAIEMGATAAVVGAVAINNSRHFVPCACADEIEDGGHDAVAAADPAPLYAA